MLFSVLSFVFTYLCESGWVDCCAMGFGLYVIAAPSDIVIYKTIFLVKWIHYDKVSKRYQYILRLEHRTCIIHGYRSRHIEIIPIGKADFTTTLNFVYILSTPHISKFIFNNVMWRLGKNWVCSSALHCVCVGYSFLRRLLRFKSFLLN